MWKLSEQKFENSNKYLPIFIQQAWIGMNWHRCETSYVVFTCLPSGMHWIPYSIECFFCKFLHIPSCTAWKASRYGVISGPYFPAFGMNTEIYFVNLLIQSEYRKIRTRNNSVFGHFSCSDEIQVWICGLWNWWWKHTYFFTIILTDLSKNVGRNGWVVFKNSKVHFICRNINSPLPKLINCIILRNKPVHQLLGQVRLSWMKLSHPC